MNFLQNIIKSNTRNLFFSLAIASLALGACSKEEDTPTPANPNTPVATGSMELKFDNIAGNQEVVLNTGSLTNVHGEAFNITTLKYFVSNIVLERTDGFKYIVPQDSSYFLIDESNPASTKPLLRNVPEGTYNKITFNLGVDSLRSTMDASRRTGALDVSGAASGMYWTWNSGYIFYKFEATSPAVSSPIQFHIGGFGGFSTPMPNNNRKITLNFPSGALVRANRKASSVHIMHDVMKMKNGQAMNVQFANTSRIMSGPNASLIANNYQSAFEVDHIHN